MRGMRLLPNIRSPRDIQGYGREDLLELARELREYILSVARRTGGHYASNIGVVELAIALHYVYDFGVDRLVWDVGHQCYPHKLLTGRFERFPTLRQKGGVCGFPDPAEDPVHDLFHTGHGGASVSVTLGMALANALQGGKRKTVAVIGDGSVAEGMAFEALNHAGHADSDLLVVLNDNEMSISPTVGGLGRYLARFRSPAFHRLGRYVSKFRFSTFYTETRDQVYRLLDRLPGGGRVERGYKHLTGGLVATLAGNIFEHLGFKYYGPVDGHDLTDLISILRTIKTGERRPVLLHILTKKGFGDPSAVSDPLKFHAFKPPSPDREFARQGKAPFTDLFARAAIDLADRDPAVTAITAAMPEGTGLVEFQKRFPQRFFDVGMAEQHAVGMAAGMAKLGMKPIAAIYSTFLQRAYDQVFQEVALQNLPVTLCLDRAGIVGPDGATHNGMFDLAYLRCFPNMTIMAPSDGWEMRAMLAYALAHEGPHAIRYPRTAAVAPEFEAPHAPIEPGRGELVRPGRDLCLLALGPFLYFALEAAQALAEQGIEAAVWNPRFVKPIDERAVKQIIDSYPAVITIEEGVLSGGFGSAVLEAARRTGADADKVFCRGLPDRFIAHATRAEVWRDLGLSPEGIAESAREVLLALERAHGAGADAGAVADRREAAADRPALRRVTG
ncbi:MAG: 1-deoxy-D-xylulose-5-phosphate synthase [Planctomycetes bacterium]|nr:1-deoxy-D-xylulose-5-phosphate synthase [Planctomycetota bacterium]